MRTRKSRRQEEHRTWCHHSLFCVQRANTKERWRKHAEGEDYTPSVPTPPPQSAGSFRPSAGTEANYRGASQDVGFVEDYYVKHEAGSGGGNRWEGLEQGRTDTESGILL